MRYASVRKDFGMKRLIFVGSSSEDLDEAKKVCKLLTGPDNLEGRLWSEMFEPGLFNFEALERMLEVCCGAVFIFRGDDETTIREHSVRAPRANVVLEFGLVAGRMGRQNVAVCQYHGAELPSDLAGMTVIRMNPADDDPNPDDFRRQAESHLQHWSSRLVATAEGVPRTSIVHGYTGRWDFELRLQKWRDLALASPYFAQVNGVFDLFIPAGGQAGTGFAHGNLEYKVMDPVSHDSAFHGEHRTGHQIVNAVCLKCGSLELTTRAFSLQRSYSPVGTPPPQLADLETVLEPWSAHWVLRPVADRPNTLEGTFQAEGAVVTEGTVTAIRHADVS